MKKTTETTTGLKAHTMRVRLTFFEEVLGTSSNNQRSRQSARENIPSAP